MMTETSAGVGEPSQLIVPKPSAFTAKSMMPKFGASISVRQNRPTTTGASTIGRIAAMRKSHWPAGICITSSARPRPMTSCSATVLTV